MRTFDVSKTSVHRISQSLESFPEPHEPPPLLPGSAIDTYRLEKAKRANRPDPRFQEAQAIFARLNEAEAVRLRGGRPRKMV